MSNMHSRPTGKAQTIKKLFSRQTSVVIDTAALAEAIWKLSTNAEAYTSWNSTVVELTGKIAPGEKLVLRSTLAADRKFKLNMKAFEPHKLLLWGDTMGTRTYSLTPIADRQLDS